MGYPKHIYKRAADELARRRQAALDEENARRVEIERKIPEIAAIETEMAETVRTVTRTVVAAPGKAAKIIPQMAEKNLALQERRAALLAAAGYPTDYLAERRACGLCGGSGYVGQEMCECFKTLLQKEAFAELSAVSQAKNSAFEDFSIELYPDRPLAPNTVSPRSHMADVLAFCKKYAQGFAPGAKSLLMLGHTGLGKTHLSLAIASAVTEAGCGVVYTPVQKLMDKLEATKFSYAAEAKEQYARDMEHILTCDLLVLDDLGAEFITQFSASALYNIVNTRLVENRPTIISTNLEPAEIEAKYSPRMLSRLMGGYRVLKFMGKDIRFLKKIRQ